MMFMRQIRRNAVKLDGERSTALDLAYGRLVLVSAFFVLAYMMLFVRAFDLSVMQTINVSGDNGQTIQSEIVSNQNDGILRRGNIYDRNGVILATTLKTSSLYADSKFISDAKVTAEGLVKIFPELSLGDVLQKLQSGKRFVWIKRGLKPDQQYAVLKLGEPGLEFEEEFQRFYPQGNMAAHLVGYSNVDDAGLAGIERGFDNYLRGGADLTLTLDSRLQHALRREMLRAVHEFDAMAAAGVVMDVETGDIMAGVSLPDFNPHMAGSVEDKQIFNRLTLGAYELGSVFKIFSTAAFFETNDVSMDVSFDAREPIKIGRHTINDYHAEDRVLTAPEVFMYSSNIGSAMMGQAVGNEKLKKFYEDLGLLTPMDFEVREVARPLVPNPWNEINTLTASYGHGVTTTPLQLASAVSSVVNGGYFIKPRLVLDKNASPEKLRIMSAQTSERMRGLLRLVVTDGTGKNANVKGYRVGGKTGTAEKIVNGRYDNKKKMSSFVGAFPMDNPRYVVFIVVDEPQGQKHTYGYATGGWVGAPAVGRVIASMGSILGIPPARDGSLQNAFGADLKQYVSAKEKR